MASQYIPTTRIHSVQFSLGGDDDALRESCGEISNVELYNDRDPYEGGPIDLCLGTFDQSYNCKTCLNDKHNCMGHDGHIMLNYPVWSPLAFLDMIKWLKLVCFACGNSLVAYDRYKHIPASKRLAEASKLSTGYEKPCACGNPSHPVIKRSQKEHLELIAEYRRDDKIDRREILYPHICAKILDRIPDDLVANMGRPLTSHPRKCVRFVVKVPPVNLRPDSIKIGTRATISDTTTLIQLIQKRNLAAPRLPINGPIDAKTDKLIWDLNEAYYTFVRGHGESAQLSLAWRIKGKQGQMRQNMLGKRTRNMCRSTITGDHTMRIDEIGVPLIFAKTVRIREVVQQHNRARLAQMVQNGRTEYPGASRVIKKLTGVLYDGVTAKAVELEDGDIVERDPVTGDIMNFNRQPSLRSSNICAMTIRVMEDPSFLTIRMNPVACPLFDADFDGDAMNLIVHASDAGRVEIEHLSALRERAITLSDATVALGESEDSLLGLYELTKHDTRFDKYNAMLLFRNSPIVPDFSDVIPVGKTPDGRPLYTGRQCVSKLFDRTQINYTCIPSSYQSDLAHLINYDDKDKKLNIVLGQVDGVLDKRSVGKGSSMFGLVANEFGSPRMLELIYGLQQMGIAHIMQTGATMGIKDLMMNKSAVIKIHELTNDLITKSYLISDQLTAGEIIPPIGSTVKQFYEQQQINALTLTDEFTDVIVEQIDTKNNNLFKMIISGSKGSNPMMCNMQAVVGSRTINGERMKTNFGEGRANVYFRRYDPDPTSRGFVANSYATGLTSCEIIPAAQMSRSELIMKSLSTSLAGEQSRESSTSLASLVSDNFRMVVRREHVVQLAYGEDFLDARKLERVKFPGVFASDAKFAAMYEHKDFPEQFNTLKKDKEKYKKAYLCLEQMSIKELATEERRIAVNCARVVNDLIITVESVGRESNQSNLSDSVKAVDALCSDIPYVFVNSFQRVKKTVLPQYILNASWLIQMSIRMTLHPKFLQENKLTPPMITIVGDQIKTRVLFACIDPGTAVGMIAGQSFIAPVTQYMLDAHKRSASGGSSRSNINSIKELMGAMPTAKLSNPSMLIRVSERENDRAHVASIASNIETIKLEHFTVHVAIFFEKFGEPVHPQYVDESAICKEFLAANPLLTPPSDLIRWCVRFELSKTSMILKNISVEMIIARLREAHENIYVVATPENAPKIIVRIYIRNVAFGGKTADLNLIKNQSDAFLGTTIRGVDGIKNASVVKLIRSRINDDGSVERIPDAWGITTSGTNLLKILTMPNINSASVLTDAIQEIAKILGIEAARQRIIQGLKEMGNTEYRHFTIYADEMTFTGQVTSITSSGIKARNVSDVLMRIGKAAPTATLEEAALMGFKDVVTGVAAKLLIGSYPNVGTVMNSVRANEQFIKANLEKPDDILEDLL